MQFLGSTRSLAREECRSHQAWPARDLWIDVSRLRIHCLRGGRRGSPPVLLLHGGGLDAAGLSFRNTIPALAEQHRVFAPDWPGFGQSDAMPIRWRVEDCVDFVGRLLNALDLTTNGGYV